MPALPSGRALPTNSPEKVVCIAASRWSGPADFSLPSGKRLIAAAIAGLVMGYSARMAFGCNVGAYLGGIASASVHGWVWFALAFAGSIVGVRIRRRVDA